MQHWHPRDRKRPAFRLLPPPEKPDKIKPGKKVKERPEQLWQECIVLGRKLEGMQSNGRATVKQAKDP